MHFNAFDMLVPVHQSPGLWRHPESRIDEFDQLDYWTSLAQTLERAGFSSLFLADVPGVYDVYGSSHHAAARGGVQYPLLDPQVIIPALAGATTHLGFGLTASVTYEQPYLLARRFATLDHLTRGRIAWNIVTSYQDSAARGQKFAVDHGEAIFVINAKPEKLAQQVQDTRAALKEAGRDPQSVKFSAMVTVVVGETEEEAQARLADYKRYVDTEAALTLFGGWTGVDLSDLKDEDYVADVQTEANQSALAMFTKDPSQQWTVRDVAEFISIGGRGPLIVGDPSQVVDQLEHFQQVSGVDGFNISAAVRPADFERFEHYVTPELKRRGLLEERPETPVTLREQLLGAGPHLAEDHPARRLG